MSTHINSKVFKSYDIRGVYPTDLTLDTAYAIGQGFAQLTGATHVVVGRDMRIGSPEIFERLTHGLRSQGVQVTSIGMVSIDMVYYAVGHYPEYDGGLMITASHNPKEYNGIKMVVQHEGGLQWIRGKELYDFIQDKTFTDDGSAKLDERDIMDDYITHVLSFADLDKIKPFTIVCDAGNGMAGKVMPELFQRLPGTLIPLNFKLDGNFPAHPSNPLLPESQTEIKTAVVEHNADFGVIFDGDTDRLFFITEKGDFIRADATLLVLARFFLTHNPGAGIAYNVICSKAVPQRITEWGGRPLRSKVGFVNLATMMREHDGIMSGELSAHYAFKDNFYADSGFIALVILLMLISEHNAPLSDIVDGLIPYAKGDEVNLEVSNIPDIIAKLKKQYADGKQDELDGLTVQYDTWWFNVRPSNTEPLLRVTVEGDTSDLLTTKQKEVVDYITSIEK